MRSWFNLKGLKTWPWSTPDELLSKRLISSDKLVYDNLPAPEIPAPEHDYENIQEAKHYVHGVIKTEIKEGNNTRLVK